MGTDLDWIVVQSKPSQEKRATENVKRQGCEAYSPYAFDPSVNRHGPLFRSYLFVRTDREAWGFLKNTFGVQRVLTLGERAATISAEIIHRLRLSEDSEGVIHIPRPGQSIQPGDQVRVKFGAFVGQLGIYQGMNAHQRFNVLLSILGRQTRVSLDRAMVEKTGINQEEAKRFAFA